MDGVLSGLRPYTPDDLPQLTQVIKAARAWPPDTVATTGDIQGRWRRRGILPEADVSVLPGEDGAGLVASLQSVHWGHGTPRVAFEIAVLPAFQRQGIGAALYKLVEAKAGSLQVYHLTSPVFVGANDPRSECASFLQHRGFTVESSYWQMRVDGLRELSPVQWPAGIGCRVFRNPDADAERWAQLIRACFNEQATADGIRAQLTEEGVSPDGYFFAVDRNTGEEIGTSRARIDLINGVCVGYVGTVGVLPDYRGRGIAEALVNQTLHYLAMQGTDSATLFVENSNYKARNLYDKLGWRRVFRTDHYWKHLPQPADQAWGR